MALLETRKVSKSYGKLRAVTGLDLMVEEGELRGLIGPNGAGKTTVFNLLTGFDVPTEGKVFFRGEDITAMPAHKVAQKGMARSFQQSFLFMYATVLENVMMGCHMSCQAGPVCEFLHTSRASRYDRLARQRVLEIIEFMGLEGVKDQLAGSLSHGHQRALGVSIALACNPRLLLLDEPVTGMNPTESAEMVERIKSIRAQGITVILVEHSMEVVMNVCDRITVISYGRKIAEGPPEEIRANPEVIEAYLGREEGQDAAGD
jgi:branched-chain amino acid transport system ATP-binding protein